MSVCIFGESALEFMRSSGRLAPEFLDKPRTQKLDGCGVSPKAMFTDDMERLGVKTRPVHILVSKESGARNRDDIVCHRSAAELPPRSLIYVNRDVLVTSPALTFLHLATVDLHKKQQRTVEELAMIGLELCGTYLLDDSWDGLTNTAKPLTSVEQIARVLDAMPGAPGIVRAREALELVGDGSNSPMESVLCALPGRGDSAVMPSGPSRLTIASQPPTGTVMWTLHSQAIRSVSSTRAASSMQSSRPAAMTAGRTSWWVRGGPY